MMAAMMLPSLVPAALAFARAGERTVAAFVAGYAGVWTAAGLVAYPCSTGCARSTPASSPGIARAAMWRPA